MLADGDIIQYRELKKIAIGDYLLKLDRFVTENEPNNQHSVPKKK